MAPICARDQVMASNDCQPDVNASKRLWKIEALSGYGAVVDCQ